jgi:predicted amino acid racemase
MFLRTTQLRNTGLIEAGAYFHQKGMIAPNTYLIDLDAVRKNASMIKEEAARQGIELYFMTKQFGRNPLVARAITESGITKAVAVDPWEALHLADNGISLGHVGHLVQIPKNMMEPILKHRPEVVTVFSYENAKIVAETAQSIGYIQKILLRVVGTDDHIYPGQQGGIPIRNLKYEVERIALLKGVYISGVTAFPCLLAHEERVEPTANFATLQEAKQILGAKGFTELQINTPSVSAVSTLSLLKKLGSTHAEPGHALTGTTPLHENGAEPEIPAMIYVSEVSHSDQGNAYVYGGGFYPRSHMKGALVGSSPDHLSFTKANLDDSESIDYYATLDTDKVSVSVGDTALFSFRTQIFVTRATVAVVEGIGHDPRISGLYNSGGILL